MYVPSLSQRPAPMSPYTCANIFQVPVTIHSTPPTPSHSVTDNGFEVVPAFIALKSAQRCYSPGIMHLSRQSEPDPPKPAVKCQ